MMWHLEHASSPIWKGWRGQNGLPANTSVGHVLQVSPKQHLDLTNINPQRHTLLIRAERNCPPLRLLEHGDRGSKLV